MFVSGRQNHGSGNNGSRQRAATRLVDPGDHSTTAPAGFVFKAVHPPPHLRSQPCSKISESFPKSGKTSFLRNQESSFFMTFRIPAFAETTIAGVSFKGLAAGPHRKAF
jgi:hypothetical protein